MIDINNPTAKPDRTDIEKLLSSNPAVYLAYNYHLQNKLTYEEMLILLVCHLAQQNEQLEKALNQEMAWSVRR